MGWLYRNIVRPGLFSWDSEEIHDHTLNGLGWISRHEVLREMVAGFFESPSLPVSMWGLRFPNPVGVAAGMDKRAVAAPIWSSLGFGFSELGGVTRHPQPGNPVPRMFRAIPDQALINRMGFNNPGCVELARALADWRQKGLWPRHPVGINLGKSKITPLEEAAEDYGTSFGELWHLADFFVVNVSSPNTPNLRQLQDKSALQDILLHLQAINVDLAAKTQNSTKTKPILVKVAPDLSLGALDDIVDLTSPCSLSGLVATNTTLNRPTTSDLGLQRIYDETGGLSGLPLRSRSTEIIRHLWRQTQGRLPIIGVGGVFSAEDAWEKITAGASLIQLYSGLVYEGPGLPRSIVSGLQDRLQTHGFKSIHEAVGINSDSVRTLPLAQPV